MALFLFSFSSVHGQSEDSNGAADPFFEIYKSPEGETYFPEHRESYYTKYYRAAELPSLLKHREPKGHVRVRLGILPSFTKPLFLTYFRNDAGAFIEVRRLSLRENEEGGAIEPNKVELSGLIRISNRDGRVLERDALLAEVRQLFNGLTEEQRSLYLGLDGTVWIIEVCTSKDYTVEDVWSPSTWSPDLLEFAKSENVPKVDPVHFIEFCEFMLERADIQVSKEGLPELRSE